MANTRRMVLVDVLAIVFGTSSWVEISGLGVEMPLMVQVLPEGWKLGSFVVVITQLANIGPFLYWVARKFKSHKVLEVPTIHCTLLVACVSCLLLAFFWDKTSFIAGQEHSTALLCLAFCLALVDCTSSVLYLPFMATFKEIYVVSCMIGEGACGFIPSIVGFIQGVGGSPECSNSTNTTDFEINLQVQPRFSVSVYFITLFLMVAISWMAFVMLDKWPRLQSEKACIGETSADRYNVPIVDQNIIRNYDSLSDMTGDIQPQSSPGEWFRNSEYYWLLAIQTYVCVMHNGILSSIQSFSCMPYGSMTYHLSVNLSLIANPIGCAIALFRPAWKLKSVFILTLFNTIWAVYIIGIALRSPTPPLMQNAIGAILIVTSWTVYVGSVSYIKASIAAILRRNGGNAALFWGGAMSQVGSGFGGVAMFFVVNYTHLFISGSSC